MIRWIFYRIIGNPLEIVIRENMSSNKLSIHFYPQKLKYLENIPEILPHFSTEKGNEH